MSAEQDKNNIVKLKSIYGESSNTANDKSLKVVPLTSKEPLSIAA
jgi:hypothetical protein